MPDFNAGAKYGKYFDELLKHYTTKQYIGYDFTPNFSILTGH